MSSFGIRPLALLCPSERPEFAGMVKNVQRKAGARNPEPGGGLDTVHRAESRVRVADNTVCDNSVSLLACDIRLGRAG